MRSRQCCSVRMLLGRRAPGSGAKGRRCEAGALRSHEASKPFTPAGSLLSDTVPEHAVPREPVDANEPVQLDEHSTELMPTECGYRNSSQNQPTESQ